MDLPDLRAAARYELNCAAAHPIGPGSQEIFALQLPIPAGVSGAGWLSVRFIAEQSASSNITITGPHMPPVPVRVAILGAGQPATPPPPLPPFPVPSPSPSPSAP